MTLQSMQAGTCLPETKVKLRNKSSSSGIWREVEQCNRWIYCEAKDTFKLQGSSQPWTTPPHVTPTLLLVVAENQAFQAFLRHR